MIKYKIIYNDLLGEIAAARTKCYANFFLDKSWMWLLCVTLGPPPLTRLCPGSVIINSLRKNYMLLIGYQLEWQLTEPELLGRRHISIFRNHPALNYNLEIKKTNMKRNKLENPTEALAVNIKASQSDNQFTFLISMKFSHHTDGTQPGPQKSG